MSSNDRTTIDFYAAEAETYVTHARSASPKLQAFLDQLPEKADILELGCGGGRDSEAMLAAGYNVTPSDGTAEIAAEAEKRLGRPVRVMLFSDIDESELYDGVWANACLLHVPRDELADTIRRIHTALRGGGLFYASYKAGDSDGRDAFDRYYNYPSEDWLKAEIYTSSDWESIDIQSGKGSGYDHQPTDWLHVTARKRPA